MFSSAKPSPLHKRLSKRFQDLPDLFYASFHPEKRSDPSICLENLALAKRLGFDDTLFSTSDTAAILCGNTIAEDSAPIATAYSGHQFGHFVPLLGDGRAHLLGDILAASGERFELQLKGSGRTPFSRRGDGLSPLGPAIREYIVSNALYALGVPSTQTLSVVCSSDSAIRETASPAAVLCRVARSHIRVGSFEYARIRQDVDALQQLCDFCIRHFYPEIDLDDPQRALAFFKAVCLAQAQLLSQWMAFGFVHGVMNTDNTSIVGDTIDFGPCAFLDTYDPDAMFSYIDTQGRYAFSNQVAICHWNLSVLGHALLPLLGEDESRAMAEIGESLDLFLETYETCFLGTMGRKLGLSDVTETTKRLVNEFLGILAENKLDYTLAFKGLEWQIGGEDKDTPAELDIINANILSFESWLCRWREVIQASESGEAGALELLKSHNPLFIPRNHQIERVISAANLGDFGPAKQLEDILKTPFSNDFSMLSYALPPEDGDWHGVTYCGT